MCDSLGPEPNDQNVRAYIACSVVQQTNPKLDVRLAGMGERGDRIDQLIESVGLRPSEAVALVLFLRLLLGKEQ